MSTPKNLLVIVPTGTRVRYAENPYIDSAIAIDADQYENPKPVAFPGALARLDIFGIPVFDAQKWMADA